MLPRHRVCPANWVPSDRLKTDSAQTWVEGGGAKPNRLPTRDLRGKSLPYARCPQSERYPRIAANRVRSVAETSQPDRLATKRDAVPEANLLRKQPRVYGADVRGMAQSTQPKSLSSNSLWLEE